MKKLFLLKRSEGALERVKSFFSAHKVLCTSIFLPLLILLVLLRDLATQDSVQSTAQSLFPKSEDALRESASEVTFKQYLAERDAAALKHESNVKTKSVATQSIRSKPVIIGRPVTRDMPLGAEASGVLLTGAATSGPVKARLTESMMHKGETLFPDGTILLGSSQLANSRITVQFSKAVTGDDEVINILATALDSSDKAPGLKATWLTEHGLEIAATMGSALLQSTSAILEDRQSAGPFGEVRKLNFKNAALGTVGTSAKQQSDRYMENFKERAKNFSIPAGTKIQILFQNGE